MEPEKKPNYKLYVAGFAVISVLVFAGALYYYPPQTQAQSPPSTSTVTVLVSGSEATILQQQTSTAVIRQNVTVTSIASTTFTVTSLLNTTLTQTITRTETSTIPQPIPSDVVVAGTAISKTPLTTGTNILFTAGATIYRTPISNGTFSTKLPNGQTYTVTLEYAISPVGGGSCFLGVLPLYGVVESINLNWSC